jgi:hypothetical protein
MVLYSAGKMARNAASIMNRPTCGGNKKGGLAPSVGWFNGMTTYRATNATNTNLRPRTHTLRERSPSKPPS